MADWQRILEYMQTHKGITCKECQRDIGTTELRKRICELKDKGYKIIDTWEDGTNRVGNPTRYKRYFLLGKKVSEETIYAVKKLPEDAVKVNTDIKQIMRQRIIILQRQLKVALDGFNRFCKYPDALVKAEAQIWLDRIKEVEEFEKRLQEHIKSDKVKEQLNLKYNEGEKQ